MRSFDRAIRAVSVYAAFALIATLLAACGGGGGGGGGATNVSSPAPPAGTIPSASQFKGALINPARGAGAVAGDWNAATCTDSRQKNYVRSWLNEDYLFYRDAPLTSIDPNTYPGSVENLFLDYTTRAIPAKDRFSFVETQAAADATFQSGTTTSVGFTLRRDNNNGGVIRIAYVDPNGPAAASFVRGMVLARVDGVATAQNLPAAQFNKLFASAPGATSIIGVQDAIGGPIRNITVATALFSTTPLLVDQILPGTTTAYLVYNSFATPIGEVQLADAFKRYDANGVTDVVVDLRYNGGGYLDIAAQLGYLIAGAARSTGVAFETLSFNDKRTALNVTFPFRPTITGFFGNSARAGEPLATLNLQRVFVITTSSTCSASEAVINALQGVDVQVIQIGDTTCGKPYGFSQENNCTRAFFAIEFEGRNQKGVSTPVTGFTPTCNASDDFDRQLGDPAERMLATALRWQRDGTCPVTPASRAVIARSLNAGSNASSDREFITNPLDAIKLIRRPQ
jgi:C-terminal processing protease CtpA/Prc